ncbi:MAG: hypothetical protein ILP19_00530, partial [Oscillospiraceae bacterium]|nr:hypothetical protein [Oscillospiraceae bacterium]
LIHEYHVIPEDEMRDDGIRYSSDTFLYDGSAFVHDIPLGESESFEGAQFDGGRMALVKYDYENEVFVFTEFNTSDGTETNLGTSEYIGEAAEYGVCISDQIVFDGGDIYFSVAGLIGDVGYPEDYLIYKAKRGAENSIEKVWQGMPDGYEDYLPYMSIEKGDIIFYERPLYRAGLSERTFGDLICCDPKPRVLIKDFETKDIYEQYGYSLEAGDTVRVLQTAEYIDGEVYVITADCTYEPDTDSGMIYDYSVQRISYIRITPDGKQTVMDEVKR